MVRKPPPSKGLDWSDDDATRADPHAAKLSLIARVGPITVGSVFGSDGAPLTIGRGQGCAILLPIAESSRRHSRIEYRGGRFWITDLETLNGTRVNGELVQESVVLEEDDILDICGQQFQVRLGLVQGRKVVYDGFDALQVAKEIETEPIQVSRAPSWLPQQAAPPPPAGPPRVHPALLGLVVVLSALVATGMALLVVSRMGHGSDGAQQPSRPPPVVTPLAPPQQPTPAPAADKPRGPALLQAVDTLIVSTYMSGVVKEIVPRGTPVSAHETVANLEDGSLARKRQEYEKLKERFGDNDDYAEFIEQARLDLEKVHMTHIQTPSGGIVISTSTKEGDKVKRGDEIARVASRVELRLDAGAITFHEGIGTNCKVTLKPGAVVDGTLSPVSDGGWRTIALGRLPPEIEPGSMPDARAVCDGR
jgi:biotin carboxyl carrier protein